MNRLKRVTADEAVKLVSCGDRVYMHGVGAFPMRLAKALSKREDLRNVEINHLHIELDNPCSKPGSNFFVDNYFIGKNQRKAIDQGYSSYIPCFLSDLPKLMMTTRKPKVSFLHVSPPDRHGFCSLGVEICTAWAAAQTSDILIAQVNPNMPRTHGQSNIHINKFSAVVDSNDPLPCINLKPTTLVEKKIGNYVAELIPDGATLQMGIGGIPNAVLESLMNHKNLGVHTEMFSDGLIPLLENGVVNNSHKIISPHQTITSFVMGSQKVYDYINDNPSILFQDISFVNNPHIIQKNPKVVAINSAVEVDLSGQVCADSVGQRMISGVGGQLDFERGAALSRGGIPLICLPSQRNGKSTIVPTIKPGGGITTSRNHVHYVVTEYGAVCLFGKDLLERARLLISIAHPNDRQELQKSVFEIYRVLV